MKKIKYFIAALVIMFAFVLTSCTTNEEVIQKTDLEYVVDVLNENLITYQGNDTINSVTGNVILLTGSNENVSVTWKSNNESVITSGGVVTRTEENVIVKLTATATYNEESLSKTFELTVLALNNSEDSGNENASLNSISEVKKMEADTVAKISGTIIGVYAKGFMVYDGTGYMLVFLNDIPTNNVGDYVEVSGAISAYKEEMQFTNTCTVTTLTTGTDYTFDTKEISQDKLDSEAAKLTYGEKISILATVNSVTTSYINMSVNGAAYGVAIAYYEDSNKINVGSIYKVTGYYMYTNTYGSSTSIYIMATDIVENDKYTISFDYNGIDSISAYKDMAVGTLPTPEQFGYKFVGWYYNDTLVTEKTVFTSDAKLSAKFEEIVVSDEIKAQVQNVIDLISQLGDVSATDEFKASLETVESAYNALTDDAKLLVSNIDDLKAARQSYDKLVQTNSTLATFEFGANGDATHKDGDSMTEYSETNNSYTLSITNAEKTYKGATDAKGNSCLKMGTSKAVGSFVFTVSDDVNKVIIKVAGYKAKDAKLLINGVEYSITTYSDNGEYTEIEIDTSVTKTVTISTTSSAYRAMINSISFIG